ncbi:MAG: flavin reductase family protein [Acetobacteraceae bacterium]|nr:flavin reductase family protein [Acetobacteraceae bacterium]
MAEFASYDFESLSPAEAYRLTVNTVVPRPIAWTVTKGLSGVVNVAPHSFFNAFGDNPVLLILGLIGSRDPARRHKDTAAHIEATGEFVINLVPEHLAEKMNATVINAPPEVSEMALAGLTPVPSLKVAPPRIGESPVAFECKLVQVIDTGTSQFVVVGRVVQMHIDRAFLEGPEDRPHIKTEDLRLIARMHGRGFYARTTDLFDMPRPADWGTEAKG